MKEEKDPAEATAGEAEATAAAGADMAVGEVEAEATVEEEDTEAVEDTAVAATVNVDMREIGAQFRSKRAKKLTLQSSP